MSKRQRPAGLPTAPASTGDDVRVVGAREPCPCGSGRRYKACHGKNTSPHATRVVRPFAGMASESDWVAMHDMVASATAPLTLAPPTLAAADRSVTLCTLLPMAWPALTRQNGEVLLAAQTQTSSADVGRDLGDALARALEADPGTPIPPRPLPSDAPHVSDLIDATRPLRVTVHSGFDFWLDDADSADPEALAGLERANAVVGPTARLASVDGCYWMMLGDRRQVRWVLAEDESPLVDALARMQSADGLALDEGSRYLGSFRASGLVVPVWDLAAGREADQVEDAAAAFRERLDEALADDSPLTGAQRRAREALRARQLTIH